MGQISQNQRPTVSPGVAFSALYLQEEQVWEELISYRKYLPHLDFLFKNLQNPQVLVIGMNSAFWYVVSSSHL
jgi:hypothetical protein